MIQSAIIATISTLIPLCFGIYSWRLTKSRLRLITGYTAFSLICDIVGISLVLNNHQNSTVISMFAVGQLLILGLYYIDLITHKPRSRIVYVLYVLLNTVLFSFVFVFNDPSNYSVALRVLALVDIVIVILSLLSFYVMLKRLALDRIELDPDFWIVSGLLIRMTGSIILALSPDIINSITWTTLWIYFNNIMLILMNLLFALAIYLSIKSPS